MTRKSSSYRQSLLEALTDPVEAKEYLNAVIEDSPEGFLKALRNVAQAHQMTKVAKEAGVQRETLYRSLSSEGNPTWDTLSSVLKAVGLKISISLEKEPEPEPVPLTPMYAPRDEFFAKIGGTGAVFVPMNEPIKGAHYVSARAYLFQGRVTEVIGRYWNATEEVQLQGSIVTPQPSIRLGSDFMPLVAREYHPTGA